MNIVILIVQSKTFINNIIILPSLSSSNYISINNIIKNKLNIDGKVFNKKISTINSISYVHINMLFSYPFQLHLIKERFEQLLENYFNQNAPKKFRRICSKKHPMPNITKIFIWSINSYQVPKEIKQRPKR